MSFHSEDQKWTAYVLDELDAAERASVEQELAESAEARQFVEELRSTMRLLTAELKSEPIHALSAEQRAAIHEQAQPQVTLPEQRSFVRRRWAEISVVAASVVVLAALLKPSIQAAREAAWGGSSDLPSGYYLEDSVHYSPPGAEFKLSQEEARSLKSDKNYIVAKPTFKREGKSPNIPYTIGKPVYEAVPRPLTESRGPATGVDDGRQESDRFGDVTVAGTPVSGTPAKQPAAIDEAPSASDPAAGQYTDERGKLDPWSAVDQSGVPFDDREPIAMPDEKTWYELTQRRKEYAGVDLKKANEQTIRRKGFANPYLEKTKEPDRQTYGYNAPGWKRWPGKKGGQADEKNAVSQIRPDVPQAVSAVLSDASNSSAEAYDHVTDNPFYPAKQNSLSTFSIDVDTASYSNIRRFLTQNGVLPPPAAVRIEEMINYFRYDYPQPEGDVPFSVTTEVAGCPWNAGHRLVRVGLKGREIDAKKRPASNLVFLLDVSGSMTDANKLPLVREAMKLLVEQLTENDRVAIVVYAGSTGCVLGSTTGDKQREIREAIDRLEAGGSTNGAGGIQHAYEIASQNFIKGGTNRVILATDGDFNVGITDREQLIKLITEQAKSGVFLTTLGFGMGNLKDGTLEQLADKGNGNYAYIDDLREGKKVFVEQMQGTLITIAKDVKIQIEFNPAEVASYRLIGYENRILAHEDFNDDKKDAGEIGAGHTVTALYEIAPAAGAAAEEARPAVDELKYQPKPAAAPVKNDAQPGELLTLKLRYKQPDGDTSKLIESVLTDSGQPYGKATADFKFASAVALFGMILRDSPHKGTGTIDGAIELGLEGLSKDDGGYRTEFVELVKAAKAIAGK